MGSDELEFDKNLNMILVFHVACIFIKKLEVNLNPVGKMVSGILVKCMFPA